MVEELFLKYVEENAPIGHNLQVQHGSFLASCHQCCDVFFSPRKPGILIWSPMGRWATHTHIHTTQWSHVMIRLPSCLLSSCFHPVWDHHCGCCSSSGGCGDGRRGHCLCRASYRSDEVLEPLLGETVWRYSEDDRRLDQSQSVVWYCTFLEVYAVMHLCFYFSNSKISSDKVEVVLNPKHVIGFTLECKTIISFYLFFAIKNQEWFRDKWKKYKYCHS